MKRLLCLLLALGCLLALPGCRSREERQDIRRQLDYATGRLQPEERDYALKDGTTLEPQTYYDDAGVTCTVLGIYEEGGDSNTWYIPYSIRNDSSSQAEISLESIAINGWQMSIGNGWLEVTPGGMDYDSYRIYYSDLPELLTQQPVYSVQLTGWVYQKDKESQGTTRQDFDCTILTSNGPAPAEEGLPGQSIYEDEAVTITFLGIAEERWQYRLQFAVENHGKEGIYLHECYEDEEDAPCVASINHLFSGDFDEGYLYGTSVLPGGRAVLDWELNCDDLEEQGDIRRASDITSFALPVTISRDNGRDYHVALEWTSDKAE